MKKLLTFLLSCFFISGIFSQVMRTDTIKLGKRQNFLGICSMKDKGLITMVIDNKENCFILDFYDISFEKKWTINISNKDLDFIPSSSTSYVLFSDNYIYLLGYYVSGFRMNRFNINCSPKFFKSNVVQLGYDGKVKKIQLNDTYEGGFVSCSVNSDELNICLSKIYFMSFGNNNYNYFTISPSLKVSGVNHIAAPENQWKMDTYYDSIAYFTCINNDGYNGWILPLKKVDGKVIGITNGTVKKDLHFEHISENFNPCPDYHIRDQNMNTKATSIYEGPMTRIYYHFKTNSFYNYGLLTDEKQAIFHKQGFYIDKYKLNGKKYYTREYSFIDYKNECKEVESELCDHGVNNRNHLTYFFADDEEILYLVSKINNNPIFSFLLDNEGKMKKVSYNPYVEFGSFDFSPQTNGESNNFKSLFYTNVNYTEGDNIIFKYLSDIRQSYKTAKRKVALNLYKLKNCNIVAVYNEKDQQVVLNKYNK